MPHADTDRLLPLPFLPPPEGLAPFVVSSDIDIRFVYPVSQAFSVQPETIVLLNPQHASAFLAFVAQSSPGNLFTQPWLYAAVELGVSPGYRLTYYGRELRG